MSEGALFDPRDFVIADGIAHLWPVAQSACLHRHVTTFSRYLRDKINSMAGRFAPIPDGSPMRATRPLLTLGWEFTSVSNASDTGPLEKSGTGHLPFLLAIPCSNVPLR